jgi:hypothetical protein
VTDFEATVLAREPDARRRAGRYYTPETLVRLVARRVLEPLVARAATVEGILALRVLDPACGAGAFLLGALEVLEDALAARGVDRREARAEVARGVLLGLDTDERALERAREALAVAAGVEPLGLRRGDALADGGLARQARCARLDAVLGNPPYRREKDGRDELARARASALGRRYATGKMDLWFLFAHAALEALPPGGRHGFVVPSYWLDAAGARELRAHLRRAFQLETLVELGARRFFESVAGRHAVYVGERTDSPDLAAPVERVELAPALEGEPPLEPALLEGRAHPAVARRTASLGELWLADGRVARSSELASLAARVERAGVVAPILVAEGVTPGPEAWTASVARRAAAAVGTSIARLETERALRRGEGVFVLDADEVARARLERAPELLPWAAPADVPSFPARPVASRQVLYLDSGARPSPRALEHLERFRPALDRRRETLLGRRAWFELHWPRSRALFVGPRVLLPRMVARPRATFVDEPLVTGESVLVIRFDDAARTRLAAALLETEPLRAWLLERAKRRGVGIDVSVALARPRDPPRELVAGENAAVEPVARALESGDGAAADRLAWELYAPAVSASSATSSAREARKGGRSGRCRRA